MSRVILFVALLFLFACNTNKNKSKNEKGDSQVKDTVVVVDTNVVVIEKRVEKEDNNYTPENRGEGSQNITEKQNEDTERILVSWNNTKAKEQIISFVKMVTDKNSDEYIPEENRIATFDLDGTLWPEQPSYFQILFVFDRIKELAQQNPKLRKDKLVKAVMNDDIETIRKYGAAGLGNLMSIAQSGMTTDEFNEIVKQWFKTARHPQTNRLYSYMIYKPMIEMVNYLKENNFKVYVVSGGGIDFMRPVVTEVLGLQDYEVIGSRQELKYELREDKPVLVKKPMVEFTCNDQGKVVAIYQIIGKKPVIAFGNSDEDIPMFEWTMSGSGKRMAVLIHHTDSVREWAYDKNSRAGTLDKGLVKAKSDGWLIIDMAKDWSDIYVQTKPEV